MDLDRPHGRSDPDLRLLGPAAACWLAVFAGRAWPAGWLLAGAVALTIVAVAGRRHLALVGVVTLLAAAAGLTASGVRALARTTGPVPELAAVGADVVVRARVTADPIARDGVAHGRAYHLVIVPATVLRLDADDGRSWRLKQPVLVLASSGAWTALQPSQEVTAAGRLAPPRRGDDIAAVLDARGPPSGPSPPSTVQRTAGHVRAGLRQAASGLPGQRSALLPALVDGDTAGLTARTEAEFKATGLTHLVAVSGENLAIVTGVVLAGVRRLRAAPRTAAAVTLAVIVGFVVVARPSPSVLRAAVMGGIAAVGLLGGHRRQALAGLSAAVLLLVLADPSLAGQAGFALSVLASLGLLVLAPGMAAVLARRLPRWVAVAVAVPAAAQLACAPVIASIGGGLSLVAVPANLLAAPAVPPATILGVAAAACAPVSGVLAHGLAWLASWPCAWLLWVAHVGAQVPAAIVPWPSGTAGALLLAAVAGLTLVTCRRVILRT